MAIATYERTLYSDRTPFDQNAAQITPLSAAEVRGQGVFNQSRCNVCHAGSLFSDNQFHNIGVRPQTEDTGRFQVTGNANNIGEFRTPSLRNVGLRGPYFHDGHFATLEEVVAFYNRGGDFDAPNIDHNLIRPLGLSPQQQSDLVLSQGADRRAGHNRRRHRLAYALNVITASTVKLPQRYARCRRQHSRG